MAHPLSSLKKDEEIVETEEIHQLVTFKIKDEEFALDIHSVQEIIRLMEITEVPKAPTIIEGVINLRGTVIPVVDLRKRLDLGVIENTKNTRIIVVHIGKKAIGFIVDSVKEVLRINEKIIDPPPPILESKNLESMSGIAKLEDDRLVMLLDFTALFSKTEIVALDKISDRK